MVPAASGVPVRHLLQWNHPGHMWDMGWRRRGRQKGEERQRGRTRLVSATWLSPPPPLPATSALVVQWMMPVPYSAIFVWAIRRQLAGAPNFKE
jgi:hypothetical protein